MQVPAPVLAGVVLLGALSLSSCAVSPLNTAFPSPSGSVPGSKASGSPSIPAELPTLGPDGAGALTLGMAKREAPATGLASGTHGANGTCGEASDGRLRGSNPADQTDPDGKLYFSRKSAKLVIISATEGMLTPQGIHLGSNLAAVKKAYPAWKGYRKNANGLGTVPVPGNSQASYRIYVDDDQVQTLALLASDQDCAG